MASTSPTGATVSMLSSPRDETDGGRRHAYAQILRSTALIGGSSVANVILTVIRTKAMAILLGPSGLGLMGLYVSIADVAQSLAGMGIQNSGVRQIAEAVGSEDRTRIARTSGVLKRTAVALGVVGGLLLVVCARPLSLMTFGSIEQAPGVALLSVAVLCREVAAGQSALIQGLRRISDLARLNVLSALFGAIIGIPLVYIFGTDGIVPSLIAVAGASVVASTWYSRKVQLPDVAITVRQVRQEAAALLKLGFAFMATAFLTMGAAYAIRIIVLRSAGIEAAGMYQSAWALGGLYVSFILQAMGADFYPRLTAVARDNGACNRMVNEQAHISLLLAGPGVIATLTLAPLVIALFYSTNFYPAVTILRWICLGMTLRVVAWPMGYIIVAKGAQSIMIATEVAAALVHVGLAFFLVRTVGLDGSGAAFCGLYVWHGLLIYAIVRRVSGFEWSAENRKLGMIFFPLTAAVFCGFYLLPAWLAVTIGMATATFTGIYSARTLLTLVPPESISPVVGWTCRLLGIGAAEPVKGVAQL